MNKEDITKYSVLLPTYNKVNYLKYTIESVLKNDYKNFELIISNDFSTDGTEEYLSTINDKRVKIIKPPVKLTQTKNYEFLLTFASGEWVTILGDDDGFLPFFFEKIDKFVDKFKDIKLIHTKPAFYYWEDVEDYYGPRVCDYQNFFEKPKLKNSKKALLMALAGLNVRSDLPMIYTSGLVRMDLVKEIKKKSGNFFFHSVIPDYYSMIALLYETEKYLEIKQPIVWVGTSKKSTGRGTKIYEDKKNQNYEFINKELEISKNVSEKLHKIGLSTIYFFECILKHPYISKKWKSNFIKYIVYASSKKLFNDLYKKKMHTIKINISKKEFLNELNEEIKKNSMSKIYLKITELCLSILYSVKFLSQLLIKIKFYLLKRLPNKYNILITQDRQKFKNFLLCNDFIKKNEKKNLN